MIAVAAALVVVATTLLHAAVAAGERPHSRGAAVYALALVLAAALLLLAPRVQSRVVSLGAGLASGGAIATAITGVAWRNGVPNPLVRGDVAFNVADVAIAVGVALLVGGSLWVAWTRRSELGEAL